MHISRAWRGAKGSIALDVDFHMIFAVDPSRLQGRHHILCNLFNIMRIMRLCISCSLSAVKYRLARYGHQAASSSLCGSLSSSTACVASMILARSIASGLIRQPLANAAVKKSLVKHSNSSLNSDSSLSDCELVTRQFSLCSIFAIVSASANCICCFGDSLDLIVSSSLT